MRRKWQTAVDVTNYSEIINDFLITTNLSVCEMKLLQMQRENCQWENQRWFLYSSIGDHAWEAAAEGEGGTNKIVYNWSNPADRRNFYYPRTRVAVTSSSSAISLPARLSCESSLRTHWTMNSFWKLKPLIADDGGISPAGLIYPGIWARRENCSRNREKERPGHCRRPITIRECLLNPTILSVSSFHSSG